MGPDSSCYWSIGQRLVVSASHGIGSENRSEEHTSELQSHLNLVCRLLLEKKNTRPKSKRVPIDYARFDLKKRIMIAATIKLTSQRSRTAQDGSTVCLLCNHPSRDRGTDLY